MRSHASRMSSNARRKNTSRRSSSAASTSRSCSSYQTPWLCSLSSCSRDFATGPLSFHCFDLLKPPAVPLAAVELSGEKDPHELGGHVGADHARADAQHVHVVVLHALVR